MSFADGGGNQYLGKEEDYPTGGLVLLDSHPEEVVFHKAVWTEVFYLVLTSGSFGNSQLRRNCFKSLVRRS